MKNNDEHNTGTHLDSHANIAVCGKYCRVVADTGFKADITAFSNEVGQMLEVPIVDALILYENPSSGERFLLVVRNVLHVPSMNHNLIPPFAMRQAGIIVNDKAKIFCDKPTRDDHAIIDKETGIHIILSIENTFSVFPTREPNDDDLYNQDIPIVTITPAGIWDPGSHLYQQNERALMDHDGDIVYYDKEDHYITDDRKTDLEYFRDTYGYDIAAMHVDEPPECYSSIYDSNDIVTSVAESTVLCNGPPDPPEWLGYRID